MWFILIILAALVIYFNLFYQKGNKVKKIKRETIQQPGKKSVKTNNAASSWIFQRQIDEPGVPPIINTYRKKLNGKRLSYFKRMLNSLNNDEIDNVQKNLTIMQLTEPLLELAKLELIEDYLVQDYLGGAYTFLVEFYPVSGAVGQLKNIKDISEFLPDVPLLENFLDDAFTEAKARNEIISIIKKNGFIYRKDLFNLESFMAVHLQEYLINRLISYGQIEQDKQGKFIIYKLKEKEKE